MTSLPSSDSDPAVPLYPLERAFILQLQRGAPSDTIAYSGRIEHVASGEVSTFSTLAEMTAFVERTLRCAAD